MARRPEKPSSRGRPSEVALDWLKEPDQQAAETPAVGQPSLRGPDGGWRPNQPAPTDSGPYAAARPIDDSGPIVDSGRTLSRRAARAQREAEATAEADAEQAPRPDSHPSVAIRERERATRTKETRTKETPNETPPAPKPGPGRRRVATWLTIAALILALWSATAFIDSANVILTGLASLSLVVAVFALPVIAIGVASRHLVPTAIAVVAALLPWTLVVGYAVAGPGPTSVGTSKTLRVMSVDGAQGRASAKDIVQVARIYSADVVVVTGLTSDLAHQLTVDGLNTLATAQWVMVPHSGMNGTGVWSGPKIDNLTPITELSKPGVDGVIESGLEPIGITVVQMDGDPLRPSGHWHADLARLAKRQPATANGFIVGDLDATPWQPAFRKLTASGWRDAADVVGQGLRPTWPSWSPLPIAPLDHVLVRGGVGVTSADTTNIAGSDHRALIVTLVLPYTGGD